MDTSILTYLKFQKNPYTHRSLEFRIKSMAFFKTGKHMTYEFKIHKKTKNQTPRLEMLLSQPI